MAGARLLTYWFPLVAPWCFTLGLMMVFTLLNLLSVRSWGETEYWFASIKIVAITLFLGIGMLAITGHWPGVSGGFDEGQISLVVVGRTVFVLSAYPSAEILSSSDGVHFVPLAVPCQPPTTAEGMVPFQLDSLAASDPSDVAVACVGAAGAGSSFKQAFVSHNGGRTYQRLPDPPGGGDGAEVAMPTPTTVLLAASSGTN